MATILLTGGAGFIGAHVAKALIKRGDEVIIVDNFNSYYDPKLKRDRVALLVGKPGVEMHSVDIANRAALAEVFKKHRIDAVCHLAAQAGVRYSLKDPDSYIYSNVVGTHNVLECMREASVNKLVFASSSSVYGGNEKIPFAETDNVDRPLSLYGATKRANELQVYTAHKLYGINAFGLRFFTVYGPWGRPDMAYFLFTDKISQGKPITVYNQGNMKRDFTFIDDIVAGVVAALDRVAGFELINLGNHQPVELTRFIELIEKYVGKKAVKEFQPMPSTDFLVNYADIAKAQKLLDFQPRTNVEEGLKNFVEWYKDYYHIS